MPNGSKQKKRYFRWEVLILLLVLLSVLIHDLTTQTLYRVVVDGTSMSPTFKDLESVWATSAYSQIVKDDVVIVQFNNESKIIKRVIYTPGDIFWVACFDDIHWEPIPNDVVDDLKKANIWPMRKIVVSPNQFWLEGDNKAESYDSRIYGLFEMKYLKGVVIPWRANINNNPLPAPVVRLYNLKKQGKRITKKEFTL